MENDASTLRFKRSIEGGMSPDDVMKMYNGWAEHYENDLHALNFIAPRVAFEYMEKYIPNKQDVILDCASGTGQLGDYTKPAGYTNMHAIDFSQSCLDKAMSRGAYTQCIHSMFTDNVPQLETDSYDALVSVSCFLPNHFKVNVVKEMCRIVKPGGIVIIAFNTVWLSQWEYKNGMLEAAFDNLILEGKWTRVEKTYIDNYFREDKGLVSVFKVNQTSKTHTDS